VLPEKVDYCYLLSGACYPIKPLGELKTYLSEHNGVAFIECKDSSWIKGGMREDRYLYHHFLNFRKHRWLFRRVYWLQRTLGLKRSLPKEIKEVRFGSQWWCLPVDLLQKIIEEITGSSEIKQFFKTVWIPDECMFQSMVIKNSVPKMTSLKTLTYYCFDEKGQPKTFSKRTLPNINNVFFIRKVL